MPGPNLKPSEEEPIHMEEDLESPLGGETHAELKFYFSKIAPPSLDYMQDQINHWVDSEQIEIKQISQVIGIMEGKTPVPNLIVMIWY